jgi:hypothetical protein
MELLFVKEGGVGAKKYDSKKVWASSIFPLYDPVSLGTQVQTKVAFCSFTAALYSKFL